MKTEAIDKMLQDLKIVKDELINKTNFEHAALMRDASDMIKELRKREPTQEEIDQERAAKRIEFGLKNLDALVELAKSRIRKGDAIQPDNLRNLYKGVLEEMGEYRGS